MQDLLVMKRPIVENKWRVLPLIETDAYKAMALDEAISEFVAKGGPPTIRFWRWNPSAVSIGYFQCILDEVDADLCKEMKIDIVRRRTGGGAVYHDYNGEITYSVIAPLGMFPKNIIESYKAICGWIISGLQKLGIQSEFKPINDILVDGKKISGNAQTRRNGVLLQHGTILCDLDIRTMFSLLKVSKEKISDKFIQAVEERVTSLKKHSITDMDKVYTALVNGFTQNKEWSFGELTDEEIKKAEELARTKYAAREWNFQR